MNRTMKLRSNATIPSRSGGIKRRRKFSGGSVRVKILGQHQQDAGRVPVAREGLDPAEDHNADQDDQVDRQHVGQDLLQVLHESTCLGAGVRRGH